MFMLIFRYITETNNFYYIVTFYNPEESFLKKQYLAYSKENWCRGRTNEKIHQNRIDKKHFHATNGRVNCLNMLHIGGSKEDNINDASSVDEKGLKTTYFYITYCCGCT